MDHSLKTDSKNIDLIELFEKWYQHYMNVKSELSFKEGCIQQVNDEKRCLTDTVHHLQADRSNWQESVSQNMHNLHLLDEYMGKNDCLLKELEEKEQEMKVDRQQFKDSIKALEAAYAHEMDELKERLNQNHEAELRQLNATIQELNEKQSSLQQSMQRQRRKTDTELATLTMDYESKIARIQRQNDAFAQQQQMVHSVDLFNRKTQDLKTMYEMEIAELKSQLEKLRQQEAWPRGPRKSFQDCQTHRQPGKSNKLSLSYFK